MSEPEVAKKRSPWLYLGIGCGAALLLALLGLVGLGVLAYRKGKQIEADMKDPVAQAAKVREMLGGEIPSGYHPVVAFSVPFLIDTAVLSTQPPGDEGKPDARTHHEFAYVKATGMGEAQDKLKSYLQGNTDDPQVLRETNISVEGEETIRRGALTFAGQETLYLAQRARYSAHNDDFRNGLATTILVDCPQDTRQRFALWFGPDPAPEEPVDKVDWTGSVADEAALRDFIGQFKLCGK